MLSYDDLTWESLRSDQSGWITGIATYQGRSVPVNVDGVGSLIFRSDGEIQASGSLTVSGFGDSLVPRSMTDPLAPFGQEIALWRNVQIGESQWPIPLGVYRITSAASDGQRFREDQPLDWSVPLTVADRFKRIRDDDFLYVESPVPGNSVWDEVRRLSPVPVQEALGDADVPAGTVYTTRLGAVTTLINLLGGRPQMTREGVLTARPRDAWLTETEPVATVNGTISFSSEMTDDFFNQVQVSNPNDAAIVAYWQLNDDSDPRSVSRAGGRTYPPQSSPIYYTQAAANAAAATIGARVSTRRARTVNVTCTPEVLLLELGDFVLIQDPVQRRQVLGEVSTMTVPMDPTAAIGMTVIVAEESDYSEETPEAWPTYFSIGDEFASGLYRITTSGDDELLWYMDSLYYILGGLTESADAGLYEMDV